MPLPYPEAVPVPMSRNANGEQLQLLLHSSFMVSFLGYEPYEAAPADPKAILTLALTP